MIKCLATFSALALALVVTACTVHQSDSAPPLTGPSDFAQSISITSNPDRLTQDGQSQSAITVRVFDATGSPATGVPIRLDLLVDGTVVDFGTLSARNLVTASDGRAATVYTAAPAPPPASQVSNTVTIRAIAVGTNAQASNSFSTDIRLVPPGVILPPAGTPTAAFTVSPTPAGSNVPLNFDASSSLPGTNATLISYRWTFGDGSSASGRTVSKTFSTPGTFSVTLTVTNDRGIAASTTQPVSVGTTTAPTAAFTFSPASPATLQPVNFNAVASRAAPGRTITSYAWNFGDGSAEKTGVTAQHDFGIAGTFSVTLTVTDDAGQRGTAAQSVTVSSDGGGGGATIARFTFSPTAPTTLQQVFFNASLSTASTGHTLTTFSWDFGDGTTGSGVSVAHAFAAAGTFTVTLTVTDDIGQKGILATPVLIAAGGGGSPTPPTPPTPSFEFSPAAPGVGEFIFFNASTSSAGPGRRIAAYNWTFGDGKSATSPSPTASSHFYETAGTYSVILTVTDDGVPPLSATSAPKSITVGDPPAPTSKFTYSPISPAVGQQVVFDASTSTTAQGQTLMDVAWNFGDGTPVVHCPGDPTCTSTNRISAHTYAFSGTFVVNLVVTDSALRTGSSSQQITVVPPAPTAVLLLFKMGGNTIQADGSGSTATGSSSIASYRFIWGDGTSDTVGATSSASHTFGVAGVHTVTLVVTDNAVPARTGATSKDITTP